jgi:hypothetical protein
VNLDMNYEKIGAAQEKFLEELYSKGFPREFRPVFYPPDKEEPTIRDCVVELVSGLKPHLRFWADWTQPDTLPKLPLLGEGESGNYRWVIDAEHRAWMETMRGLPLSLRPMEAFLNTLKVTDFASLERVCKLLQRKAPMPPWMKSALAAGWTPPISFYKEDYEV